MTAPAPIPLGDDDGWRRKVRDALNMLLSNTQVSGPTGDRPPRPTKKGQVYYDETLGIPIWWNGTVWKNAAGVTV